MFGWKRGMKPSSVPMRMVIICKFYHKGIGCVGFMAVAD